LPPARLSNAVAPGRDRGERESVEELRQQSPPFLGQVVRIVLSRVLPPRRVGTSCTDRGHNRSTCRLHLMGLPCQVSGALKKSVTGLRGRSRRGVGVTAAEFPQHPADREPEAALSGTAALPGITHPIKRNRRTP